MEIIKYFILHEEEVGGADYPTDVVEYTKFNFRNCLAFQVGSMENLYEVVLNVIILQKYHEMQRIDGVMHINNSDFLLRPLYTSRFYLNAENCCMKNPHVISSLAHGGLSDATSMSVCDDLFREQLKKKSSKELKDAIKLLTPKWFAWWSKNEL